MYSFFKYTAESRSTSTERLAPTGKVTGIITQEYIWYESVCDFGLVITVRFVFALNEFFLNADRFHALSQNDAQ